MWKNEVINAHISKQMKNKKHNVEKHVKWIHVHVSIPIVHIWRCSYYDSFISLYQGQKLLFNLIYLTKY